MAGRSPGFPRFALFILISGLLKEGQNKGIAHPIADDLYLSRKQPVIHVCRQKRGVGVLCFEPFEDVVGLVDGSLAVAQDQDRQLLQWIEVFGKYILWELNFDICCIVVEPEKLVSYYFLIVILVLFCIFTKISLIKEAK